MTHEGHISLYKEDEIIATKFYRCLVNRKEITKTWMALYGKGYKECAIHIQPVPGVEINKDGTNKNVYEGRGENGRMLKSLA